MVFRSIILVFISWSFISCSSNNFNTQDLVKEIKNDEEGMLFGGKTVKGLSIAVKKSGLGDSKVEVALKNDGSKNLVLYSSFRVYSGQIGSASDIFLRVIENESKLELNLKEFSTKGGSDNSHPDGFVTLKPGEYVSKVIDIATYFSLKQGAKFTVMAEYDHLETGYDSASGNWVEMDAWAGRCASNKLIIHIK